MQYLGVIGHPMKRSLSPVFQQAALDHLRLDIAYQAWPTPPDGLETRIIGLRAPAVLGANVTIPHKETVIPLLDEVDDLVRRVGAVNTIVNKDGRLHGHNTDVNGFLRALRQDGGLEPAGQRVVVTGAGGAAHAVVAGLLQAGAASVCVINRTFIRAEKLVADMRAAAGATKLQALPDRPEDWRKALNGAALLVNCTSVGSEGALSDSAEEKNSPVPLEIVNSGALAGLLVFDLIYRPALTPLMAAAQRAGARVLGGLPMLIHQGASSFQMWTGREAPVDIMLTAAQDALLREGA